DAHAALDRLDHVVDGETGDRHGGERLHFDTGAPAHLHGGADLEARRLALRLDIDGDLRDGEGMAQWNQLVGSLGRHDAGDARGADHVALRGIALEHEVYRLSLHAHSTFR